ncbi:MAG: DUF1559 domain-containing protein [Planctomyces sp.]|nr:DUF1559 domain-containing protein [Planctomyces sp.]
MSRRTLTSGLALIVISLLLVCAGLVAPLQAVFAILFGWMRHAEGTLPNVSISGAGVLSFAALLGLTGLMIHVSGRAAFRSRQFHRIRDRWPTRWTWMLLGAIALVFAGAVSIVGIAHQAAWLATSEERLIYSNSYEFMGRVVNKNNQKHLGLGMHNFIDQAGRLPAGGTYDESGRALHGWLTSILPYTDQASLFRRIDLQETWKSPRHRSVFETPVPGFMNPALPQQSKTQGGYAPASYSANERLLGINRGLRLSDITDGTSQTILAGDVVESIPAWGSASNWRDPARGINRGPRTFGSPSSYGAAFLFADGSVRILSRNTAPEVLEALATPAGGEDPGDF